MRGDGARRQPEDLGQGAGVRLGAVSGEPVDGLQGLALGLGEGVVHRWFDLWRHEILALARAGSGAPSKSMGGIVPQNGCEGTRSDWPGCARLRTLILTHRQERHPRPEEPDAQHPVPAVDGWFTIDDEPRAAGHPLHHLRHRVLPGADGLLPQPRLPGSRVRRGRAVPHRAPVWSYTDAQYQPAAPVHPGRARSTCPFALAAVELAEEQLVVLGQVADGYGVDDLSVGATVELVVEPLYEVDGVPTSSTAGSRWLGGGWLR